MADPQAALLTQLRNIQSKTGRTIGELQDAVLASGLTRHGERRSWLIERFALGYGDANTVVALIGKLPAEVAGGGTPPAAAPTAAEAADPLDVLYAGAKAGLRPVHDAVMALVARLGPCEQAPKKSYISLRRQKQFAMVGPATRELVEIGFNAKDLPAHPRLKRLPPGGMCQATTRVGSVAEVDGELESWLKRAYDAAG